MTMSTLVPLLVIFVVFLLVLRYTDRGYSPMLRDQDRRRYERRLARQERRRPAPRPRGRHR